MSKSSRANALASLVCIPLLAACGASPGSSAPPPSLNAAEPMVDPALSTIVDDAVARAAARDNVREALVIVLDPRTGEILAVRGKRHTPQGTESMQAVGEQLAANAAFRAASVTKTFTVAAALDAGAIRPDQTFASPNGSWVVDGRTVSDRTPHPEMTVTDVMTFSSNVGAAQIAVALGRERLGAAFARFHLAKDVPFATFSPYDTAAMGAGGLKETPLQIAASFASVVNDGIYHEPTRTRRAQAGQRVVRPETARTVMAMLEATVTRDDGTGKEARVPGCRVAGKTGTSGDGDGWLYGTFVGTFPVEKPRIVILASVVTREGSGYSGGTIAAPLFREIAQAIIAKSGC